MHKLLLPFYTLLGTTVIPKWKVYLLVFIHKALKCFNSKRHEIVFVLRKIMELEGVGETVYRKRRAYYFMFLYCPLIIKVFY